MDFIELFKLFLSFLQVGAFSFGGGMAAMPLIQEQVVDTHAWLSLGEFTDLVTIAEMTPGPIAVNSATFVGTKIAGLPGAIICTIGCILPACIFVSILARLYIKYSDLSIIQGVLNGLRPAVVSLIASAGVSILLHAVFDTESGTALIGEAIKGVADWATAIGSVNFIAIGLFLAALFVLRKFKLSPIVVMLSTGVIGGAVYLVQGYMANGTI